MIRQYIFSALLIFTLVSSLTGQNIPRANYTGPFGAQVNTYNGNLYLQRTDIAIPNQDLPIGLSFSFNSFRDSTDAGYGYGWSHSYTLRCLPYDGGVVVERAHGRQDSFQFANEQYLPPAGIFDKLVEIGSGTYELQDKYGMVYRFENPEHHYVTSMENTNGNQLQLTYTDSLLATISDASGRSVTLQYSDGHLTSITDQNFPGGRSWDFQYTSGMQLECVANPFGDCVSYEYDESGRMVAYLDERGNKLSIRYDEANRVSLLQTCLRTTTFAYNEEQFRTTVTEQNDGGNQITTFVYNEEGKLIRKTGNCCGYDMGYSYDAENNLSEVVDANGNSRVATYDGMGNTVATQDALAQQQGMAFGELNRLTSYTDKRNNSTAFEYDDNGNLTHIIQPLGVEMTFTYDGEGNIASMTDGEGNETEMGYNANNDLTEVQYEIGSEQYTYDNAGNLTSTTDANGNITTMAYDALNRLTKIEDELGNEIQYTYDAASNLTQEVDPEGNVKDYDYDPHSRLIQVETPVGETHYGYDALDNLTNITNAEGHTTHFDYDTRSRLVAERDAMGFTTHYEYDNNGNVIQRVDANMQVTTYKYDALNRLTRQEYAGNIDNFEYDANGNIVRAGNNDISYTFTYDALNRLISKTADNWGLTIRYEYDMAGNRTKMIDPDGGVTNYVYDGNNRLVQLTNPSGETTTFTYDLAGRLTEQRNHNGTYAAYQYDAANRLVSLFNRKSNGEVLTSYEYEYNSNGLRTSMTDHTGGTATYEYDGENRLTRVVYTDGTTEEYTFDKAGNRTSLNQDGEVTNYTYDAADRIESAGTTTYNFDGNGNMVQKTDTEGTTHYEYDGENRLVRATLPNGDIVDYRYDPFGNRITRQAADDITRYFLDGDNVLMELDESNNALARYTAGLMMDSWISMQRGGNSYTYHTDALGGIVGLSDFTQELVNTYTYDAYGNIRSITEGVENNYRFTGREWDGDVKLYYYRARYYNEKVGAFISKDVFKGIVRFPISQNKYIYGICDPINNVDPNGLWPTALAGIIVNLYKQIFVDKVGLECLNFTELGAAVLLGPPQTKREVASFLVGALGSFIGYDRLGKIASSVIDPDQYNRIEKKFQKKIGLSGEKFDKRRRNRGTYKRAFLTYVFSEYFGFLMKELAIRYGDDCDDDSGNQNLAECLKKENLSCYELVIPDIIIDIIRSFDPNEIVGPEGVGQEKWVKQASTLPYTILFENDPDFATAAAQRVVITHTFDDSVNPISFRLGDFGFGPYYFEVPEGVSYYDTRLDLRDSLGIFVDVIASINQQQGQAFWIFESIDPATGLPETLPAELGFLPVNDSLTRAGEGFVNFTIQPSIAAQTGDLIEAQASIVFDGNPEIETNIAINTIDGDAPESTIAEPIDTLSAGTYQLSWQGTDVGSGVRDYTVYASTNAGAFQPIAGPFTAAETYLFSGSADSTYRFFTIARDRVDNKELLKNFGEPNCMEVRIDSLINASSGQGGGLIILGVEGNVGPLQFEWSHDPNLDSPVATDLTSGEYQVVVSDSLGCEVGLTINIDLLDQVYEDTGVFIYQLFPVPASDKINVRYTVDEPVVLMTVSDVHGQVLIRRQFRSATGQVEEHSLSVGHLPSGTYFLRLQNKKKSIIGTFSKQ